MKMGKIDIDLLSTEEIVELVRQQNLQALEAVESISSELTEAIERASESIASGGRVIFAGDDYLAELITLEAGQLTRAVNFSPRRIILLTPDIIELESRYPGGNKTVFERAADYIKKLKLEDKDTVISFAGETISPFTKLVLASAKYFNTWTILVLSASCREKAKVDLKIKINVSEEAIAGYTDFKYITSAKIILDIILTGLTALTGKLYRNYVVDFPPGSDKYSPRKVNLLTTLFEMEVDEAVKLLKLVEGDLKAAITMKLQGFSLQEAKMRLKLSGGRIRMRDD